MFKCLDTRSYGSHFGLATVWVKFWAEARRFASSTQVIMSGKPKFWRERRNVYGKSFGAAAAGIVTAHVIGAIAVPLIIPSMLVFYGGLVWAGYNTLECVDGLFNGVTDADLDKGDDIFKRFSDERLQRERRKRPRNRRRKICTTKESRDSGKQEIDNKRFVSSLHQDDLIPFTRRRRTLCCDHLLCRAL